MWITAGEGGHDYEAPCAIFVAAYAVPSHQGCATPARLMAAPADATAKAEIVGMPGVRYAQPDGVPAVSGNAQVLHWPNNAALIGAAKNLFNLNRSTIFSGVSYQSQASLSR